ncbi:hypothetical protein E2C01_052363 [Portunus trituberculatus]|uniref:Uncharacterized protein n=1 Tax=Portunus trituberculatus TaxID=210409 RepID=A0A5B7GHC5_PORTR|nr:hypothetical protein [Portunus trituberculatus]
MAITDLRIPGSGAAAGHGKPMAVAKPRKQCKKYPWHHALPYLRQEMRHGSHLLCLRLRRPVAPAGPACSGLCTALLVPGWKLSTCEAKDWKPEKGGIL